MNERYKRKWKKTNEFNKKELKINAGNVNLLANLL